MLLANNILFTGPQLANLGLRSNASSVIDLDCLCDVAGVNGVRINHNLNRAIKASIQQSALRPQNNAFKPQLTLLTDWVENKFYEKRQGADKHTGLSPYYTQQGKPLTKPKQESR